MANSNDDFDGYRKWLNITSKRRPPTHYELLGIMLDEDDHEVIEAAVEQRRNYVESKQGKGHDDLVAEILMRIDEAGITLVNHEMRRDYDRQMELFEKRRKNRRVDSNAASSRFKSRPGRTVGEDGGIVKTFAGIMAIVCVAFGIMAWFSFQMPWAKKDEPIPVAPVPIAAPAQLPQTNDAIRTQPAQAEVEDPKNMIANLPLLTVVENAQRTYLVTLPRIDLSEYNGWWSDKGELILGGVGGQPINRKQLMFEGQHSVHGIYMHARPSGESSITFRLGGRFESFKTKAYIPEMLANQGDPRTPLLFIVVGDGRTLWKSTPLSKKGGHESCSVPVKGIHDLSLKIKCPGPDNWALASWIEPHLLIAEEETMPSSEAAQPASPVKLNSMSSPSSDTPKVDSFDFLTSEKPNWVYRPALLNCSRRLTTFPFKKGFDIAKSWVMAFDFSVPDLNGGSNHMLAMCGDDEVGHDPIMVWYDGPKLVVAIGNSESSRYHVIEAPLRPEQARNWVSLILFYDAGPNEMKLYLDKKLIGTQQAERPVMHRPMPIHFGGAGAAGGQRFTGEFRNIWFGNSPSKSSSNGK